MLVEFRVKNFKSIQDEQCFSMVASKDKTLQDSNLLKTGIKPVPSILRSAAIYGANGGGKSNLIKALQCMREVVMGSPTSVQPFLLDSQSSDKPTEFEVIFLLDGSCYQYGFALKEKCIIREYLMIYKTSRPSCLFDREGDTYQFGSLLKGPKQLWQKSTTNKALFLSNAAQLNSKVLSSIFNWFANYVCIYNEHIPFSQQKSIHMLEKPELRQDFIDLFMSCSDMNFSDIEVKKNGEKIEDVLLTYVNEHGKYVSSLKNESNGMRKLFFFCGFILDALKQGTLLVIDSLDRSLHTLLVRCLIGFFHEPTQHHAQLVFTTQDVSLLDALGLFRRDQIWFVEKNNHQATKLYSLDKFIKKPKHEAVGHNYLTGRYGGIPFLIGKL